MKKNRSRKNRGHGPRVPGMGLEIHRLAGKLMRQLRKLYPHADPYAFRDDAERVFHQALTRRIRGKPRGDSRVTKAERIWRRQLADIRRNKRKKVCWVLIAAKCIPGFRNLPETEWRRQLNRLKNAVINRTHRAAKRARARAKARKADHAESECP